MKLDRFLLIRPMSGLTLSIRLQLCSQEDYLARLPALALAKTIYGTEFRELSIRKYKEYKILLRFSAILNTHRSRSRTNTEGVTRSLQQFTIICIIKRKITFIHRLQKRSQKQRNQFKDVCFSLPKYFCISFENFGSQRYRLLGIYHFVMIL